MDINNKYDRRGVSFDKKDVHDAIKNIDKGLYPNSFCKIIPDIIDNDDEMCLIMHADGAGTKSSLAYAYWKETNDISVWKGISQDSLIMNIDDLICVGATKNIVVSSTIGRNKKLIPGAVLKEIIEGNEEIIKLLNSFNLNIISSNCKNGPKEFLLNGKGGYLFENNNSHDFLLKFNEFMKDDLSDKFKKKILAKRETKKFSFLYQFNSFTKILSN